MKFALLILLLLSSLSLSSPLSFQQQDKAKPDWKYLLSSEDDRDTWKTYYDAANIERLPQGLVRVWLKQIPVTKNDAERQRIVNALIANRKINNMKTEGYDKFAYSLTLVEFDCSGRKGRSIAIKDYDQAQKELSSDAREEAPFAPVPAGSMSAVVMEAACK